MTKTSRADLRWLVPLIFAALLIFASTALAQQEPTGGDPIDQIPQAASWLTLPVRIGIFIFLLIVAYAFGFYAIFPWILDRKKAMRPLATYGLTAGLIWLAWCTSAFVVFQDLLVQKSLNTGPPLGEFLEGWLLTCAICLAALIGFALLWMVFSGRSRAAED